MKYKIYQLPVEHQIKFMSLSFAMDHGGVHKADYSEVYSDQIEGVEVKNLDERSVQEILEKIYTAFNTSHPVDFTGHSLSMSDLVEIDDVGIYYCDTYGWKKIS